MRCAWMLILVLLAGCRMNTPADDWRGEVDLLPVVITDGGHTDWEIYQVAEQCEAVNIYWRDTGVRFRRLAPVYFQDAQLIRIEGLPEWGRALQLCRELAADHEAYPVLFVDWIEWSLGIAGGMSCTPRFPEPWDVGSMVAVCNADELWTTAHELGHAWGLDHPPDYRDCPSCNVMSYCYPRPNCVVSPFMTADQVAAVRSWCIADSRRRFVKTTSGKMPPVRRAARSASTQPAVDYVEVVGP